MSRRNWKHQKFIQILRAERACVRARSFGDHFKRFNRISCVEWIACSPLSTVLVLVVLKMRFTAFEIELKPSGDNAQNEAGIIFDGTCARCTWLDAFHFHWCVLKIDDDALDSSLWIKVCTHHFESPWNVFAVTRIIKKDKIIIFTGAIDSVTLSCFGENNDQMPRCLTMVIVRMAHFSHFIFGIILDVVDT